MLQPLTHWRRVTHISVSKRIYASVNQTIIGSDNGLSPGRRQAIIWINADILSVGPLGINFSEILMEIRTFSFKKMRSKMSSAKWWSSCLGLNVLMQLCRDVERLSHRGSNHSFVIDEFTFSRTISPLVFHWNQVCVSNIHVQVSFDHECLVFFES